jgi:hypothetical protein
MQIGGPMLENEVEELLLYLRESLKEFRKVPPDTSFLRGYEYAHQLWVAMIEDARCANVLIEGQIAEVNRNYGPGFCSGFESGIGKRAFYCTGCARGWRRVTPGPAGSSERLD